MTVNEANDAIPESYIHLMIPLRRSVELACDWLGQRFLERWGIRAACVENPKLGSLVNQLRKYVLTDGKNTILLTLVAKPLTGSLVEVVLQAAHDIDEEEQRMLNENGGAILIDYALGSDEAIERMTFVAKSLIILMELEDALGCLVGAAQCYRTKARLDHLRSLEMTALNPAILLLLFTNTHVVAEASQTWLHTHGMEQFTLPDLEIRVSDVETNHWAELLDHLALYMIENGPVVQVGHTMSLSGDDDVFTIRSTSTPIEFGAFGAFQLVRKAAGDNVD